MSCTSPNDWRDDEVNVASLRADCWLLILFSSIIGDRSTRVRDISSLRVVLLEWWSSK